MKLSMNLIKGKEKSLLKVPMEQVNIYEEFSKYRVGMNNNPANCMQFAKVFFYLLVVFAILVVGWTGLKCLTPKLSSSIWRTDTPLVDSEIRRLLYGFDRRIENEDHNGIPAEDGPFISMPGSMVTASTKSVKDDWRNLVESKKTTTVGVEMDEVILENLLRLWFEETTGLQTTINNQDSDESDSQMGKVGSKNSNLKIAHDTDSQHRAPPVQSLKLSDLIRNSDCIQNSNMKDSLGESFSHSRSDYASASSTSQSDNNRLSDKETEQPAPRTKRSTRTRFDETDPEREKCKGSLDLAYEMMDKLAIGFLTSDASDTRFVQFCRKFRDNMSRLFWNVILTRSDRRRTVLKKNDNQLQSLLSAMRILSTDSAQQNFVKSSPPTREMTHQFRVITETVVFGYVKCMRTLDLARRATPGDRFRDYE